MTTRSTTPLHVPVMTARGRRGALLCGALVALLDPDAPGTAAADAARQQKAVAALPSFPSCRALLTYAHSGALKARGGEGVPLRATSAPESITSPTFFAPTPSTAGDAGSGPVQPVAPTAAPAPAASQTTAGAAKEATPTFSTTNNQEAGCDEPDVVKTDGRYVYTGTDNTRRSIDIEQSSPAVIGTRSQRWTATMTAALICTVGPSRPTDAPASSIAMVAPNLAAAVLSESKGPSA